MNPFLERAIPLLEKFYSSFSNHSRASFESEIIADVNIRDHVITRYENEYEHEYEHEYEYEYAEYVMYTEKKYP